MKKGTFVFQLSEWGGGDAELRSNKGRGPLGRLSIQKDQNLDPRRFSRSEHPPCLLGARHPSRVKSFVRAAGPIFLGTSMMARPHNHLLRQFGESGRSGVPLCCEGSCCVSRCAGLVVEAGCGQRHELGRSEKWAGQSSDTAQACAIPIGCRWSCGWHGHIWGCKSTLALPHCFGS